MNLTSKERTTLYTTTGEFCRIFREDMNSLYLLSLVLTADPAKAEQCFVAGLDDCAAGNRVFKDWARSWARRVVIKNAIRMIFSNGAQVAQGKNGHGAGSADLVAEVARPELPPELSSLLGLPALERFAFVISVCEGYSDHDCALLLGCTRAELIAARSQALQRIGDSEEARNALHADTILMPGSDRQNSIEMLSSMRLATSA